jgi:transposase-like protein
MGKIKRKFDVQFKIQICQALESGAATMAAVCREYQIQKNMVEGWLARHASGELENKSTSRLQQVERENEKLRAKVGELTMQIDVLKKVDAWKRQQRSVGSSIITPKNLAQFQRPAAPLESSPLPTTTARRKRR